jgi:hypothetical protein
LRRLGAVECIIVELCIIPFGAGVKLTGYTEWYTQAVYIESAFFVYLSSYGLSCRLILKAATRSCRATSNANSKAAANKNKTIRKSCLSTTCLLYLTELFNSYLSPDKI